MCICVCLGEEGGGVTNLRMRPSVVGLARTEKSLVFLYTGTPPSALEIGVFLRKPPQKIQIPRRKREKIVDYIMDCQRNYRSS